uniref:Uncharacterized protein n=1 Tax=Arundo donax TaxID=35708 RepID=A0A0A8YR16_ARUDO
MWAPARRRRRRGGRGRRRTRRWRRSSPPRRAASRGASRPSTTMTSSRTLQWTADTSGSEYAHDDAAPASQLSDRADRPLVSSSIFLM